MMNAGSIAQRIASCADQPGPQAPLPPSAQLAAVTAQDGASVLLKLEETARTLQDPRELDLLIANESKHLVRSRQIFILHGREKLKLAAVSGLPAVERSAPLCLEFEGLAQSLRHSGAGGQEQSIDLSRQTVAPGSFLARYPFKFLHWVPLRVHGEAPAGAILFASDQPMPPQENLIARRLAGVLAHARALLDAKAKPRSPSVLKGFKRRNLVLGAALLMMAVLVFPVSMSVLAPVEIAARKPFIVSAPLDGVVQNVLVEPNQKVSKGQALVAFDDTVLRNNAAVALRQKLVAEAGFKKARQLAFQSHQGHQEIGIAQAEYALKSAELKYADDLLSRATIKAERSGVVVFSDRQELLGKPVVTGQRLMHIADPADVEAAIELDVSDGIALDPGSEVKIFLETSPLTPVRARVRFAAYEARAKPDGGMAYEVIATLEDGAVPRLGARGTAKLHGDTVPLGFYLFRRPVSALRQWIGW